MSIRESTVTAETVKDKDVRSQLREEPDTPLEQLFLQLQHVTAATARLAECCDTEALHALVSAASSLQIEDVPGLVTWLEARVSNEVLMALVIGYFQLLSSLVDAARALSFQPEFSVKPVGCHGVDESIARVRTWSEGLLVIQGWLWNLARA
jgi:hypothetical protein